MSKEAPESVPEPTLQDLASKLDPEACRLAVARIIALGGYMDLWNDEAATSVFEWVGPLAIAAGFPDIATSEGEDALVYGRMIG